MIGLILKIIYWTILSSSFIGLEKCFLNEIVQSQKYLIFQGFIIFILELTKERIKVSKRFRHHSKCFRIMHFVSKFQFFILIFAVIKLENKNQNLFFYRLFQSNISQWINDRERIVLEVDLLTRR